MAKISVLEPDFWEHLRRTKPENFKTPLRASWYSPVL